MENIVQSEKTILAKVSPLTNFATADLVNLNQNPLTLF
jgi:hypothetical protein